MKPANDFASPSAFHDSSAESQGAHTLARMALQLLCHLTFQPSAGHESKNAASIVHDCWEALIHSLPTDQRAAAKAVARTMTAEIESKAMAGVLPAHEEQMFSVLNAFVMDELG